MQTLLKHLRERYAALSFKPADNFYWSPAEQIVRYDPNADHAEARLLHELSHALLGHKCYKNDVDLLLMEVAAWQKSREIAPEFRIKISEDFVEDCLDTYRDWLHKRSTCPRCGAHSAQSSAETYICYNCHANWHVSASRFCRPYRRSAVKKQTVESTQ